MRSIKKDDSGLWLVALLVAGGTVLGGVCGLIEISATATQTAGQHRYVCGMGVLVSLVGYPCIGFFLGLCAVIIVGTVGAIRDLQRPASGSQRQLHPRPIKWDESSTSTSITLPSSQVRPGQ
jgi:hypothetical protein